MKRDFLSAVLVLVAAASLAACGGGYGSSVPTPQPTATSGAVVVYPGTASVPLGGTVYFTASLTSQSSPTFTWSLSSGTGIGSISSSTGVYTAPTTAVPNPATITVTVKSGSSTGTATITITAAQPVTVIPSALFVPAGASVNFSATAGGNPATINSWAVNGAMGGSDATGHITPSGVYTAPLTPPTGESVTVTALTTAGSGTAFATIVFSAASLNGPYAFSYTGDDPSGFLAGAGSFTANGATGTISAGVEDVIDPKTNASAVTFGGTFTVAPDGTGAASFTDGSAGAVASKFQFVLAGNALSDAGEPAQKAVFMRVDTGLAGTGTLNQQDPQVLGTPMPLPAYVFGFSGVDGHGHLLDMAGEFSSNGGFSLSPGVWDVNDPSIASTAAAVTDDTTLTGTFVSDLSHPGRGTLTLKSANTSLTVTTFSYSFYVVDNTHLMVVENDGGNFTAGDIFSAPNTNGSFAASVLNGNYAFVLGGSGSNHAYSLAGVFTANGGGTAPTGLSGSISGGVLDENGGVGSILLNATLAGQTYSIAAATGRLTFTLSTSTASSLSALSFSAYPTSLGSVLILETDTGKTVVAGIAYHQNTTAALQGGFAASFTGVPNVGSGAGAQNVAGQFAVGNGAISYGTLNIDNGSAVTAAPILQALINPPGSTGRGTATITTNPTSYPIAYYAVDTNTVLLIETDGQRVLLGTLIRQF